MPEIITRTGKASELTYAEMDQNLHRDTQSQAGNYTIQSSDNREVIEYTGAGGHSFTLPDLSTLLTGIDTGDFRVTLKHNGGGVLTIARTGANTIDGVAGDLTLYPGDSVSLAGGTVVDDYIITHRKASEFVTGTATTASIAAGGGTTLFVNVTHNLGTSDLDFGFKVKGNSTLGYISCYAVDENGKYNYCPAPAAVASLASVITPGAGVVRFALTNHHPSTAQTATVDYWIRRRPI